MLLVVDVETCGLDPRKDPVVEVALVPLLLQEGGQWQIGRGVSSLVNPGCPIPPAASAIHHIVDSDVCDAPPIDTALAQLLTLIPPGRIDAYAAHNAQFDRGFLPQFRWRWVCTLRCARHLYPAAPGHSNQMLRYWLPGLDERVRARGPVVAHRALFDAYVTAEILSLLLQTNTVQRLLALSNSPVLLDSIRFGKHRGLPWSGVPRDYLRWLATLNDLDADVRHTVEHYLEVK